MLSRTEKATYAIEMYRVFIFLTITLISITNANANEITGEATVINGDTLKIDGTSIRLYGIDAAESTQTCKRKELTYDCGREAANKLAAITTGKIVSCLPKQTDQDGQMVGLCSVGETELNKWMVVQGLALPSFEDSGMRYKQDQQQAIKLKRGLHSGSYQLPWEYRTKKDAPYIVAKIPVKTPKPHKTPEYRPPSPNPSLNKVKVFRNCSEARAAGAAPIKIGQPGYSRRLDRDGDGIGCEK